MFTIDPTKPHNVTGSQRTWFGYCARCGKFVRVKPLVGFFHRCVKQTTR